MKKDLPALLEKRHKMEEISPYADEAAKSSILGDYLETKAPETIRRQEADIACYVKYLHAAQIEGDTEELLTDLSAWGRVTFGIVEGFKRWMLREGYSIGSIGVRLATLKRYVTLARKAGHVSHETLAAVQLVKGYTPREGIQVDSRREKRRKEDKGKKARHTTITLEQAELLKKQDDPRDRLLMCLLIDHGFRCGEVAGIHIEDVDMSKRHILIHRPKVNVDGTQEMSKDVYSAMQVYLEEYAPTGFLFKGESKQQTAGKGEAESYSTRAINRRVGSLGRDLGIGSLSPHDLRHFWATYAAARGVSIHRLKQAGGWKTLEMPDRYIERSKVENEGMV